MMRRALIFGTLFSICTLPLAAAEPAASFAPATAEQLEFFEKKIRPVLAQECYACHATATKAKGGLTLDTRAGLLEGGNDGAAVVPGKPAESLLIQSIRHSDPDLKMPKDGAKLDDSVVKDFEKWVAMGAPDPREKPPSAEEIAAETAWPAVLARRRQWWSLQPVRTSPPPAVSDAAWTVNPIDPYLRAAMVAAKLAPKGDAEPRAFYRRLSFVLTGMPPAPEASDAFAKAWDADRDAAVADAADRLIASPQFGERWARHWMDWVRYAESHGSEGDPAIPFAWRYRDYLIRALNADVPYPQLLREQVAGDLLEQPRINKELGINESALGTAQLRMVLHGFTPTDAHDEMVTFTDNQIDTVSKAFLGLTVSCARCHNHKFDAISQTDFYAWFGIFTSTRPALIDVNTPERQRTNMDALRAKKNELRSALAAEWLSDLDGAIGRMRAAKLDKKLGEIPALAAWQRINAAPEAQRAEEWKKLRAEYNKTMEETKKFLDQPAFERWDMRGDDVAQWHRDGPALSDGPSPAGDFRVAVEGDAVVGAILPAGLYSSTLSDKHRGVLGSRDFLADGGKLWVHVRGKSAVARYVVRNYPRSGLIFPKQALNDENGAWVGWDLAYWKGDTVHLEVTTAEDHPIEIQNSDRSWFGIDQVLYAKDGRGAPRETKGSLLAFDTAAEPATADDLAALYAKALKGALERWRDNRATDDDAEFLNVFVRQGWLKNSVKDLASAAPLLAEYRKLEAAVPVPTRSPGVMEGFASDQPLYIRGDHHKPGEIVPRHFLDAVDNQPFNAGDKRSGRLELAENLARPDNPLTSRVIVNRLWHHVFGQGIFTTPDNTGRLGDLPSHPALLDMLAARFQAEGGSLKKMIRLLVTSRAFRMDHRPSAEALARDPQNRLLTHYSQHRLEAECIRDSLVFWSGKLDMRLEGGPVGGDSNRRSLYVNVIRNRLDPFLSAFDFPVPSASRGARDATNVPAQSLALLNDPLVARRTREWAQRIRGDARFASDADKVARMIGEAFGRAPTQSEIDDALGFLQEQRDAVAQIDAALKDAEAQKAGERIKELQQQRTQAAAPEYALQCLAQTLVNAKEFIYVR
jgi:hypothetical protein